MLWWKISLCKIQIFFATLLKTLKIDIGETGAKSTQNWPQILICKFPFHTPVSSKLLHLFNIDSLCYVICRLLCRNESSNVPSLTCVYHRVYTRHSKAELRERKNKKTAMIVIVVTESDAVVTENLRACCLRVHALKLNLKSRCNALNKIIAKFVRHTQIEAIPQNNFRPIVRFGGVTKIHNNVNRLKTRPI